MKKFYLALSHNLVKAFGDIQYPITREQLIAQVGDKKVQSDFGSYISVKELIEQLPVSRYTCGGELFCNIQCVLVKF